MSILHATMIPFGHMERASRLIGMLPFPDATINAEELVCAAWPAAVGKKIAAHTRATRMVRRRLIVFVEDAVWQRQLLALNWQILSNLAKNVGPGVVEDIEFRVAPPHVLERRGPQRANSLHAPADEADEIPDAILRRIYKEARKKALA